MVYVRISKRETIAERNRLAAADRAIDEAEKRKLELRKIETKQIVVDKIREDTEIQKNMELQDVADMDTDDEVNEIEEYEAWKAREIARIKGDREEREAMIKENVRDVTEEERQPWERKNPEPAPPRKRKLKFMQTCFHQGAFYLRGADGPAAMTAGAEYSIYQRDFSAPTGDDKMDKTILPKDHAGQALWS